MDAILGIVVVCALVFMNGFFVAAEFSFVGARKTRIAQLASEGNAGARAAQKAIGQLDTYIAATQLGITLASLGLGWVGEPAISQLLEPLFERVLPEEVARTVGATLAVVIGFSIVTMMHIVLGELTPKAIALQRPEETSIAVARLTSYFLLIFRPIIFLMNSIGNAVVRLLGFEPSGEHARVHSAEELEMLVHSSTEAGVLQQNEEQLLRRIFDFSEVSLEQVMQPRVEIDAIALDMPLNEVLRFAAEHHHARYPVYDETLDHVIGILHTRDLFVRIVGDSALPGSMTSANTIGTTETLRDLLREPLFIPATVSVDRVLELMQRQRLHFAIVVDEYGGTAGVATLEDILELIIGDVQDEHEIPTTLTVSPPGEMRVDGLENMTSIQERFGGLDEPMLSITVGGYVAERLDRIPAVGDRVRYGQYDVVVETMDGLRVAAVRFVRRQEAADVAPAAIQAASTEG